MSWSSLHIVAVILLSIITQPVFGDVTKKGWNKDATRQKMGAALAKGFIQYDEDEEISLQRNLGDFDGLNGFFNKDATRQKIGAALVQEFVENQGKEVSLRRNLGDFDDLNKLFDGLVLGLPDMYLNAGKILGATVRLWTSEMTCKKISVGDVVVSYNKASNTKFDFRVNVEDLSIECNLKWKYKWSFTSGSGRGQIYTRNNDATTLISFTSAGFDHHPPSGSSVKSCNADINISDMDFQGGIVASIVDTFEKSLRSTVEKEINSVACEELGSIGTTLVGDMLDLVYDLLESYLQDLAPDLNDVLHAEKNLVVPDDGRLIDFTDFGSTLGSKSMGNLFKRLLSAADKALGTKTPDPDLDGVTGDGYDLGINRMLRTYVLNEEGKLQVQVEDLPISGKIFEGHDLLTNTVMTLEELRIDGLDTFQSFDPLDSVGNHTLGNEFFWEELSVEMDILIVMKPSTLEDSLIVIGTDAEVREKITIDIGLKDIDVDFTFLLGIDELKLGETMLGPILQDPSNIPSCLLPSLFASEITGFSVTVGDMTYPKLDGFISSGLDHLITKSAESVYEMYEATLKKAAPNFFQITIRNFVNDFISKLVLDEDLKTYCYEAMNMPKQKYVNMGDLFLPPEEAKSIGGDGDSPYGNIVVNARSFAHNEVKKVNPITGSLYINTEVIRNITASISGTPGSLVFPQELLSAKGSLKIGELRAEYEFSLRDLKVDNLDSLGLPLNILETSSDTSISNTVTVGADNKPLTASTEVTVAFRDGVDVDLRNVILLGVELTNTTIEFDFLLRILSERLLSFPLEDLDNLYCWLSMIQPPEMTDTGVRTSNSDFNLALQHLNIIMEGVKLHVECVECSSPLIEELGEIISSDEAGADLTKLSNSLIDYISSMLGGSFLQTEMDRLLVDAPKRCPHTDKFISLDAPTTQYKAFEEPAQEKSSIDFMIIIASIIASVFLFASLSGIIIYVVRKIRFKRWLLRLSDEEMVKYKIEMLKNEDRALLLNSDTVSLFRSKLIPVYVRFLVPLLILANIGFFLSGHISLGAKVDIDAQIGGESVTIKQLFVFSMAESVIDMWEAGAKELAILVLLFSGVWPYTKQFVVLFLWFAPPRIVSVNRREGILILLDNLGKWSFVDIFILVLSIPSFRVVLSSPHDISFIPDNFYSMNLLLIPCWGLYSNMIAQIISQVNSHFIIHFHRKIIFDCEARQRGYESASDEIDDKAPRALCRHMFNRTGLKQDRPLVIRRHIHIILMAICVIFVLLLIGGCLFPSMSLSQYGLVGLAVAASPDQSAYVEHNIISMIMLLINQARFTEVLTDYIGLATLSFVVVLTVFIVPICQVLLLLRRWFKNMTKKERRRNFVAVEALQAWQYIEVYVFSVVIACWQLGSVSQFLINDYCGSFQGTFNSLAYHGIMKAEDAQCFKVIANVQHGLWLLVAASVCLLFLNNFISSAARQQERDIEDDDKEDIYFEEGKYDIKALKDAEIELKNASAQFSDFYRWLLISFDKFY